MSQIAVIAKILTKPGQRDAAKTALQILVDGTTDEAGTLLYIVHEDQVDHDVLWMYELYSDQDALGLHQGSAAMKAGGKELAPLLAGRPELFFTKPNFGKGLPA